MRPNDVPMLPMARAPNRRITGAACGVSLTYMTGAFGYVGDALRGGVSLTLGRMILPHRPRDERHGVSWSAMWNR